MAERYYFINDPIFGEFVFNCMVTASIEDRMGLDPQELHYFKTEHNMRRFADRESTEKRLLLLARIGIQFCIICAPKTVKVDNYLDEVFTQYQYVEKRQAITESMAKNKVFVMSSNDVLVGAHMAAQNSHSQVYILNYSYVKLHDKIRDFQMNGGKSVKDDESSARDAFTLMARITMALFNCQDVLEGLCGVNVNSIKVLIILYERQNTFTSAVTISHLMGDSVRSKGVNQIAYDLEMGGYIAREPGYSKGKTKNFNYMIISRGIDTVMTFFKYIHKQTF